MDDGDDDSGGAGNAPSSRLQMSLTSSHRPGPPIFIHPVLDSNHTVLLIFPHCVSSFLIASDIFFSYVRNVLGPYMVSSSFKRLSNVASSVKHS